MRQASPAAPANQPSPNLSRRERDQPSPSLSRREREYGSAHGTARSPFPTETGNGRELLPRGSAKGNTAVDGRRGGPIIRRRTRRADAEGRAAWVNFSACVKKARRTSEISIRTRLCGRIGRGEAGMVFRLAKIVAGK